MIRFTHPLFLWALTGLSVPLVIHLLDRRRGKVILLGSLRHLSQSSTQRATHIRLNELLLLLLRIVLIVLLVFVISGLQWNSDASKTKKWLLIEKGIEGNIRLRPWIDSLQQNGYESHYLAEGFPLLKDSAHVLEAASYWELAEQLNAESLTDGVAFSYNRVEGFRGERVSLSAPIRWIVLDPKPVDFPLRAVRTSPDVAQIRVGQSTSEFTSFKNSTIRISPADKYFQIDHSAKDSIAIDLPDSLHIHLAFDKSFAYDRKIMIAALQTINQVASGKIILTEETPPARNIPAAMDWLFWLSEKPVPQNLTKNHLVFQENKSPSLFERKEKNEWILNKRLDEETALKENLTLELLLLLFPSDKQWELASFKDQRVLPNAMAWGVRENREDKIPKINMDTGVARNYLMILFLLTLLTERAVAYSRNQ
jgi:hypothetical protein